MHARTKLLGSVGSLRSASEVVDGGSRENDLAPYPDDDGKGCSFADVPVDSHGNFRASLRREFDDSCNL